MKKIVSFLSVFFLLCGTECVAAQETRKTPQGQGIPWSEQQKKEALKNRLEQYSVTKYTVLTERGRHLPDPKTFNAVVGDMKVSRIVMDDPDSTVYEIATQPIEKTFHFCSGDKKTSHTLSLQLPPIIFPEDIQTRIDDFDRQYSITKDIEGVIYGDSVSEKEGADEKWLKVPGKGRELYVAVNKKYNGPACKFERGSCKRTCWAYVKALFGK